MHPFVAGEALCNVLFWDVGQFPGGPHCVMVGGIPGERHSRE